MAETSVADAKNHLTRLIYEAESGKHVHITRRGKPVAVLLSEDEYARLCQSRERRNFWDLIVEMRSDPEFEPVGWTPEEVDSWRDRRSGRDFEWPE
jgi:prevent-host-death family protein